MVDFFRIAGYRWHLLAAAGLILRAAIVDAQVTIHSEPGPSEISTRGANSGQADLNDLFALGEYQEAADAAKLLISVHLEDTDHDQLRYGRLLTQLAEAQHGMATFDTARQNYVLAIEVIEAARDRLSGELVAPLIGLSRNNVALAHYDDAVESYNRALHVHQVNKGLYGAEKAAIIAELSEAYFNLGDFKRANATQASYVNTVNRIYPVNDLARLPSLYSQADMLSRTGSNYRSLGAYRRIIALIERADSRQSVNLLPAFAAVSRLLVNHAIIDGDNDVEKARRYLRRAVSVADNSDEADARMKADTHIMLGDFLSTQSPDRITMLRSYRRAWDELSRDEKYHARRDELFATAVLLNRIPADSPPAMIDLFNNAADFDAAKTNGGIIIVQYDVNKYGRPANIHIVESSPPDYHDYIVLSHVRKLAFRPRFVDGEPVRSPEKTFEIRFSYQDEELSE